MYFNGGPLQPVLPCFGAPLRCTYVRINLFYISGMLAGPRSFRFPQESIGITTYHAHSRIRGVQDKHMHGQNWVKAGANCDARCAIMSTARILSPENDIAIHMVF